MYYLEIYGRIHQSRMKNFLNKHSCRNHLATISLPFSLPEIHELQEKKPLILLCNINRET